MPIKLRTCICCGEPKPSAAFNRTQGYTPHCKDCGVWLRLFRQAFGPQRDWEANRKYARDYYARIGRFKERAKRKQPVALLEQAWRGK